MTRLTVFAMILVMSVASPATAALPDVTITWDNGFPKKENGKLKLQGKVVFNNGWSSVDGKIIILINASAGGMSIAGSTSINADGSWSTEVDLTMFPMPAQNYDIIPLEKAQKGTATKVVSGERKTMQLP